MLSGQLHAQEIEARLYSNAPIGMNFATGGIAQAKSGSYKLTTEAVSLTHVLDIAGQSGRLSLLLPYAELSGTGTAGGQTFNALSEGMSDPVIKASANLYGAPALSLDEFKSYKQDLIIGASIAASVPWGKYNSEQMVNVGANRWFVQPGLGASQAIGPWRLELAGMATIYTNNTSLNDGCSFCWITGFMLTGSHRSERVGACTDCRRCWGKFRAGEIDEVEKDEVNDQLVASVGTCSVMGTASTMACISEALGMGAWWRNASRCYC